MAVDGCSSWLNWSLIKLIIVDQLLDNGSYWLSIGGYKLIDNGQAARKRCLRAVDNGQ